MTPTEGDLIQAIQDAMAKAEKAALEGAPGATMREIAESMGTSLYKTRKKVNQAVGAGELVVERGVRLNVLGEPTPSPVYRPAGRVP